MVGHVDALVSSVKDVTGQHEQLRVRYERLEREYQELHEAGSRLGSPAWCPGNMLCDAFYEVADPVKVSSRSSFESRGRVSRGSSSFYSRSWWRAGLAGA